MSAIVLPDIDRSTVEELRKRVPNLSEIELPALPSMGQVGRSADETIDRLLGRSRKPAWPWIAAGIALVAVLGLLAAYLAWFRTAATDEQSATDEQEDRASAGGSRTAAALTRAPDPTPDEEA